MLLLFTLSTAQAKAHSYSGKDRIDRVVLGFGGSDRVVPGHSLLLVLVLSPRFRSHLPRLKSCIGTNRLCFWDPVAASLCFLQFSFPRRWFLRSRQHGVARLSLSLSSHAELLVAPLGLRALQCSALPCFIGLVTDL